MVASLIAAGLLMAAPRPASADVLPDKVLILDTSVTGGASSAEARSAASLGFGVDVVSPTQWSEMAPAQFGSYRAIILGDATCPGSGHGDTSPISAAIANHAVWGPEVDGNVAINGTDPVFHASQGGKTLVERSIAFATDRPGVTGAYISLSCYYHGVGLATPVDVLSPFGNFTVRGVGCYNDAHIVATHPALLGLTDESLSNWSCSVHEAFDGWPSAGPGAFTVLAIAEGVGDSYRAPDGTVGAPYILARGAGLAAGDIALSPSAASIPVGTAHTLSALVTSGGSPAEGKTVTFEALSGPHQGVLGTAVSTSDGTATLTYTGTATGTDTIHASFESSPSVVQRSNEVTVVWTAPAGGPPSCATVTPSETSLFPPNHKMRPVRLAGATDPDGDAVGLVITRVTQDEPVNGLGDGDTAPDAAIGDDAGQVSLRAERSGQGDGRVYRIDFTATDSTGKACSGFVTVGVPHDNRPGAVAIDSGVSFDSLTA
ncbi:MAG: Ig-like domain-containing protein [Acidimicrobiales bacterium]